MDTAWASDRLVVHRLPMPTPKLFLREVCAYLISVGPRHMLIDAGPDDDIAWPALERGLEVRGLRTADIEIVVVTHGHRDHFGNAHRFQESGARLLTSAIDARTHDARAVDPAAYGKRLAAWLERCGVPAVDRDGWVAALARPERIGTFRPDAFLEDRDTVALGPLKLHVRSVPGHTPGHLMIEVTGEPIAFVGDHVLGEVAPNVGADPETSGDLLGAYLDSLRELANRVDTTALPGHGFAFGLPTRATELLDHQVGRGRRVLEAVAAGRSDASAIAASIWDQPTWAGFSPFLKVNAIRAIAAQLIHLEASGLVARVSGELDRYEVTGSPPAR